VAKNFRKSARGGMTSDGDGKQAILFLKKTKKIFSIRATGRFTSTVYNSKSFLLLFFKKAALSFFLRAASTRSGHHN
jgi:hypothetical protein